MGEFKAGPGDVARLAVKVRAFPDAERKSYFDRLPAEADGKVQQLALPGYSLE